MPAFLVQIIAWVMSIVSSSALIFAPISETIAAENLEKAKYHYKLGGHKLRHITEDNIAELIDGKTQLEKIRSFYN